MSNKNEGFWVILSWSYQCILDNADCVLLGASRGAIKIYLNATSTNQTRNQHPALRNPQTPRPAPRHPDTQTPRPAIVKYCQIVKFPCRFKSLSPRTFARPLYIDFWIIKILIRYNNLAKRTP